MPRMSGCGSSRPPESILAAPSGRWLPDTSGPPRCFSFPRYSAAAWRAVFVFAAWLLLTGGNARAQGSVATDRAAMVALYNATGGANWTNNTNWLTNEALSEWHGLDTDTTGRVTGLRLENNGLIGEIPAELGDLTNLIALRLYSNSLSGEIPAALGGLANLEELSLRGNALSGEIPAELGSLANLIALRLYSNSLSGEIPVELGGLSNLQELILSRNALSGEIPVELGGLSNLISLRLYSNRLSGEIPMELRGMANLQELDLNENMLTGEIPAELGGLSNLQVLSLWSNRLSGEIPLELGGLSNLQLLSLWGNALTGEIPAELGGLSQLRVLILSQNVLRGEIPAELGGLSNLEELNLWGNSLSGEIPLELGDLTNLQLLSFRGNALTGEIPAKLGKLTNLEELSLNENTLTGGIPAELGDLTNLRVLSLWGNSLSGEIPAELGKLTNLEELSLSSNGLSGPLPLTLSALSQLSVLDIRSTTLCAPADTAFQAWLATINFQGAVCAAPPPPPPPPPQPPGPGSGGGGGGPRQTVPDAPTNLVAEATDGAVVLTWEAPEDDGGSAITDYQYGINGKGWTAIGSTHTTHTVIGLVNGTVYAFQVRAVNRIGRSPASDPAETTPRAAVALDFAHFANGAGITSEIVLVNVALYPIQPALYFYDPEGHLMDPEAVVDIMGDLEIQEDGALTIQTAMEPLGELTIATHGREEPVSGSVHVVSDGTIGGLLRFDIPGIGVAGVGASAPVQDALFPARRQEGGIRTAAALHNLGAEAMEVSCQLMSGGIALEAVEFPLEANGQTAWFIEDVFAATDTSDFLGSVRCTASGRGRFTAIAAEMDAAGGIFTTLPVVEVNRGRAETTTLDFAHFANGTWITDLVFLNLSTEASGPALTPFHTATLPTRPAIYFYDTEGNPIAPESVVDLMGDLEVTEDGALTVRTEMEPLGVLTISTHGRGEIVSGSVRVVSEGPIGGMLRFDHPGIGVAGVGASPPLSDALVPVRRQDGGITTGVALHNLESSPELVRCELRQAGVLLDAATIPLEANGQTAGFLDTTFPGTDTSDFSGAVRCSAVGEGLFTGVALELDAVNRIFTTLPVVPVEH